MSGPFDPRRRQPDPRNARVEAQSQLAVARGGVQRLLEAGQLFPRDRFGNKISVGDLLMWDAKQQPIVQVQAIEMPPAERELPPTTLVVTFSCTIPYGLDVRTEAMDLTKVGTVKGEGHAEITGPQLIVPPEAERPTPAADPAAPPGDPSADTGGDAS